MTFDAPVAFQEAVDFMRRKGLLPTTMSSSQLAGLEAQLKRRAVFSARMTRMEILQLIKRDVESIVSGLRDEELGVHLSIPEAKARLREKLDEIGWETKPEDVSTIKDFYGDKRRQLIVETNVLDTLGAGRYESETSTVSVDVNPAWELVRLQQSVIPRNWPARWKAAADSVQWLGVFRPKDGEPFRMIALKSSPIWQALGSGVGGYRDTLGNPWPPFAFRSGMGIVQVSRSECEKLGLINPGQSQFPIQNAPKLNDNLSASMKAFDNELHALFQNDPMFLADRERIRLRALNSRLHLHSLAIALAEMKEAA